MNDTLPTLSVDELSSQIETLTRERDTYRTLYVTLCESYAKLERGILAQRKSEKLTHDEQQLSLLVLAQILNGNTADTPNGATSSAPEPLCPKASVTEVKAHTRVTPPTGRKPLPESLPRIDITIIPPEVKAQGEENFTIIGHEISEVLEYRRASYVVLKIIKPKFVAKARRGEATPVLCASTPELPIVKGLCGPSLLAETIVRRWCDHLPLYRQQAIFLRDGIDLSRSTLCSWHGQLAELVAPLLTAMKQDALKQPYLCADATGIRVQAPLRCKTGSMWVMVAPERHILYEYFPRHDSKAVDQLFVGYRGKLVVDAHVVYDHLFASGAVTEVGCWFHARRYFYKARASDPVRSQHALALIGRLFYLEKKLKRRTKAIREAIRKKYSQTVAESFFGWCQTERDRVLDDTPIQKALQYALNQQTALKQFLSDGDLPLSNNISERAVKPQAIGRKNWLFLGSDEGGTTNARFASLLMSCQLHRIEPHRYLRDLMCLLPNWPQTRVLELSPLRFNETIARPEVQSLLNENIVRRVVLDS